MSTNHLEDRERGRGRGGGRAFPSCDKEEGNRVFPLLVEYDMYFEECFLAVEFVSDTGFVSYLLQILSKHRKA